MSPIDCPFKAIDNILDKFIPDMILDKLISDIKVIIIDFHAETTAEKVTMGWHLNGRVSAVLGTHTHIPTADAQIFDKGTAYITDVGMSGPYDSVLGLKKEISLNRLISQISHKYESAILDNKICGVIIDIDETTGKATKIENLIYPSFFNG
jgi:hypothetical protein